MDLINPCKLWPSFCCETVQWIALEAWFRGSMQVQCVCCISAWSWLCEGGKKSICIFNFYGHCPNTPYRGCANSRYTPMMSDLYAHGWANFPVGANLWVEEWCPTNCVYVASVLTQVRLTLCVWETHCHSVFEGNEHGVCLCVLLVLFLLICRNSSHIKDMTWHKWQMCFFTVCSTF